MLLDLGAAKSHFRAEVMKPKPQEPTVALMSVIFGLCFLAAGTCTFLQTRSFVASSLITRGRVIGQQPMNDLGHQPMNDSDSCCYSVFSFNDSAGQSHQGMTSIGSYPPAYQVGTEIAVLYPHDHPELARIGSFKSLWLLPTLLCGFGFFSAVMGTLGFRASRNQSSQPV